MRLPSATTTMLWVGGGLSCFGLGLAAASSGPIVGIDGGLRVSGPASAAVALLAAFVLLAGWLIVWPSKWNIAALGVLGLWAPAYFVPLVLFDNGLSDWPGPTVRAYLGIVTLGAATLVVGLMIGNVATSGNGRVQEWMTRSRDRLHVDAVVVSRVTIASCAVASLLTLCFVAMGFVPTLAADPTSAKYLAGGYAPTRKIAYAYHLAVPMCSLMLLITMALAWETKRARLVVLALVLALLLIGTGQRGYVGAPLLAVLLLGAAVGRIPFVPVILVVALLGPLGSAANYVLSQNLGVTQFSRSDQGSTLGQAIRAGAPDVPDALHSLSNFLEAPQPTHGRTFWADISYYGNPYTPNQWAVRLANPQLSDLSQAKSGGVRLTSPQWGYYAFGWWGAAIAPLLAGIFGGLLIGAVRRVIVDSSLVYAALLSAPLVNLMAWSRSYDYFRVWACVPAAIILFWPVASASRSRPWRRQAQDSAHHVTR